MNKYYSILIIALALTLYACSEQTGTKEVTKKQRPKNILFIAIDDLKPELGCYGDTFIISPNIDRLASEGFVFTNNHCQQAVCAPSRASILTGKRPDYTKVWDLKTLIRDKNPDIITMPQYFKSLGYQTAAVGKIFDYRSVDKGADSVSWTFPFVNVKNTNPKGGGYIFETRRVATEAPDVDDSLTIDGEVVKHSIAYLDQFAKEDKPFFLAVGFFKPHLPFVAPKKYWDLYKREDIQLAPYRDAPVGAPSYAPQPGWELRTIYKDIPRDFDTPIPEEKQKELIHGYYAA
jgi:arylsulfatase A-like enzyme